MARGRGWLTLAAAAAALLMAEAADAQERGPYALQMERREAVNPRIALNLNLVGADAVGEFEQFVDGGFGGQAGLRLGVDRRAILGIRIDGGFMIYGHERQTVCFSAPIGCRIGTDLTTTNTIGYGGIGPEIAIPGPVSPYAFATYGFSWFSTQSSLSGVDDWDEELFETRHYGDFVGATRFGGGIRFRVGGHDGGAVSIDLGAEYNRNGVAEYLREGDILDHPDGSITLFPNRSEANYMTFRAGVQIGLGGGRDDDRWEDRRRRRDDRRH